MRLPTAYSVRRSIRFFIQRRTRGWDDSDTWSLDITVARFLAPRLRRFMELRGVHLDGEDDDTLSDTQIIKMCEFFEYVAAEKTICGDSAETERLEVGLTLFQKYFHYLWW